MERRAGKNKLIYLFPFIFLAFKHSIFHRQGRESAQRLGYFLGLLKVSRYLENLGISRNIDFVVFSCQKQSSWYILLDVLLCSIAEYFGELCRTNNE